ncbi:MAG: DEAD/DEAH box helicase [Actinomycetales bacterium]
MSTPQPRQPQGPPEGEPLAGFSALTRSWFTHAFSAPTAAQAAAWSAIQSGAHTLVVAPTGSGKTLAAFLTAIDQVITGTEAPSPEQRCRIVYVSPLKALASDVQRNLRTPIIGIGQEASRAGVEVHLPQVVVRSGDTSQRERRDFARHSADILITTPESLFLLLTSAAGSRLAGVSTVIVDEVHAVAGTKRGAHLALSLERLDELVPEPTQRIGLSATVRPAEHVADFVAGRRGAREIRVVAPPSTKVFDVRVEVPVPDLAEMAAAPSESGAAAPASIWPHVEARVVDLVAPHLDAVDPGSPGAQQPARSPAAAQGSLVPAKGEVSSSLVFTNSRRLAERLTARLNEEWYERLAALDAPDDANPPDSPDLAADHLDETVGGHRRPEMPSQVSGASGIARAVPALLARAHHGSVSKEQRQLIEEDLKSGRLPTVVATSSLELGIDMGLVDLVVQVESPPSVSAALQRIGRAGHQVGAVSRAVIFPKFRADLLTSAVIAERVREGAIESLQVPANPLDVLAQQVVAMVAMRDWSVDEVLTLVRRATPFATLTRPVLESVLDMLAGRYPSEEFAELRPRLVWDRLAGTLSARPGAQRLAVTSGGTIPDRGLFGVFLAGESVPEGDAGSRRVGGRRVGELDEEMVYESRVGDYFTLGASTWQIVDITHDQVLVVPAPGHAGRLPFWHGDQPGRPYELGQAVGAFTRQVAGATPEEARARLTAAGLDEWASDNLLAYLREQREATGQLSDDRTIVVERFRDELGDWRVVIHSPFGRAVHAPWAMTISAAMRAEHGVDVQAMPADDGIVLRLPDTDLDLDEQGRRASPGLSAALLTEPDNLTEKVTAELGGSALFASRFRECAARALLLPRRRPDRRSPLWQQRQRAAQLLEVAAKYPSFPIILETVRECLREVFDVPGLAGLLGDLAQGRIRMVEVETDQPSPFARSLLFGYVAQFLYEGDSPLAERRAAALALDPQLLAELLGTDQVTRLADLLDPDVVHGVHAELQRTSSDRQARSLDEVADLARILGPLTPDEIAARCREPEQVPAWLDRLISSRRLIDVRIGGQRMLAAAEDAGRLRDALGTALPVGLPVSFTEVSVDPLDELVRRYARTRAGFTLAQLSARFGLGVAVVGQVLQRLTEAGALVRGELLPEQTHDLLMEGVPPVGPAVSDGVPGEAPAGPSAEDVAQHPVTYVHEEVLRRLRRRSLAALRTEVEPVPTNRLAALVPAWQNLTRPLRGVDGVLRAVEQLSGVALPASAWETLVLPQRVADYHPGMLDELTASGEVCWAGESRLGSDDGRLSLHVGEDAAFTLALPEPVTDQRPVHEAIEALLAGGGGFFYRQIVDHVRACPDPSDGVAALVGSTEVGAGRALPADGRASPEGTRPTDGGATHPTSTRLWPPPAGDIADALWDLVWQGRVTGDTFAPVRGLLSGGKGAHPRRRTPRSRYGRPSRLGARSSSIATPPSLSGRWSILPGVRASATERAARGAEYLLDRYGVVTRGSVVAEDAPGGFARAYKVLSALEEAGRIRRGYFVEGLGASQFATTTAVDRLRAAGEWKRDLVLAACDPGNVYGAALPWPAVTDQSHRPARRAGALVVLADGRLLAYAERGARTVLTFTTDPDDQERIARALAEVVQSGRVASLTITTVDGSALLGSRHPLEKALADNGFHATPRGMRMRR